MAKKYSMVEARNIDFKIGHNVTTKDLLVWKKVRDARTRICYLVQMLIPEGTRYYKSIRGDDKVRAEYAVPVLFFKCELNARTYPWERGRNSYRTDNFYPCDRVRITHYSDHGYGHLTNYELGKKVLPDTFSERLLHCDSGIHFYPCKEKAAKW